MGSSLSVSLSNYISSPRVELVLFTKRVISVDGPKGLEDSSKSIILEVAVRTVGVLLPSGTMCRIGAVQGVGVKYRLGGWRGTSICCTHTGWKVGMMGAASLA